MPENSNFAGLQALLRVGGLPALGPGPRPEALPLKELESALTKLLPAARISANSSELTRAIILLWHDQLDAAHAIAQNISNTAGSYLHGIVHRREPDYSNARYWFHRVGRNAAFPRIAAEVAAYLPGEKNASILRKLTPNGNWDPLAFVDLCAAYNTADQEQRLRDVQAIEFRVLLNHFLGIES